jgi:hypothetical protein
MREFGADHMRTYRTLHFSSEFPAFSGIFTDLFPYVLK